MNQTPRRGQSAVEAEPQSLRPPIRESSVCKPSKEPEHVALDRVVFSVLFAILFGALGVGISIQFTRWAVGDLYERVEALEQER